MPTIASHPVGPTGFGLMNLTWRPQTTPDATSFAILKLALAHNITFWNTGEFYGTHPHPTANLELLNRYFTLYPEDAARVVLSVKGAVDITSGRLTPDGSRAGVTRSVENVLRILDGKVRVAIFQCARVDTSVPLSETISTLATYVASGKIGGIGLSEAGPGTIRAAHALHPIAAVEVEVSLWATEIFTPGGIADVCAELDIPIAAYSPLGRGFLTGAIKSPADIPEGDFRRHSERFQEGNFERNLLLVEKVSEIAARKGVTNAQLALAWVRQMGNGFGGRKTVIVPIPGATTVERARENFAGGVELTEEEMEEVERVLGGVEVVGGRYNKAFEKMLLVEHQ